MSVITINRMKKWYTLIQGVVGYDKLVMATGSYPWVPPIGNNSPDCFVYRTIEDLNAIESCARISRKGAVIGAVWGPNPPSLIPPSHLPPFP